MNGRTGRIEEGRVEGTLFACINKVKLSKFSRRSTPNSACLFLCTFWVALSSSHRLATFNRFNPFSISLSLFIYLPSPPSASRTNCRRFAVLQSDQLFPDWSPLQRRVVFVPFLLSLFVFVFAFTFVACMTCELHVLSIFKLRHCLSTRPTRAIKLRSLSCARVAFVLQCHTIYGYLSVKISFTTVFSLSLSLLLSFISLPIW